MICTKESPAQKESESEMWSLSVSYTHLDVYKRQGLCNDFIKLLNGKGNSGLTEQELENLYKVPFFIWTNYETDEMCIRDRWSSLEARRAHNPEVIGSNPIPATRCVSIVPS